ncbi:hypothetical protein [Echinicola sp. 20G]|uniref:hypothetical protein n=1 Tax=Echinicola sp. 20G TaxID=2781961 RepID=UPI00190FFAD9|nr:hypothetical protein [Echinicola sp. 20G]
MTRDQQLAYCKTCTNRKLDIEQGLICSLTSERASFTNLCGDYVEDIAAKAHLNNEVALGKEDLRSKLPEDTYERLRFEQNLPMAIFGGLLIGIIGAVIWAAITVATNFQIGYMAVAIGAMVGYCMRYVGKGIDPIFGIMGAVIAVFSCLLGNFLSSIGFIANAEGLDFVETLFLFDYNYLIPLMTETFSFMDLLFYGIAAVEGYKFAFRVITEKDLSSMK